MCWRSISGHGHLQRPEGHPPDLDTAPSVRTSTIGARLDFQEGHCQRGHFHLTPLTAAYGEAGQADTGKAILHEALGLMGRGGGHICDEELHQAKGELQLIQDGVESPVEARFHTVLEVTRRQRAKSYEFRAALSLILQWQLSCKR